MKNSEISLGDLDGSSKQIATREKLNVNSPKGGPKTTNIFASAAPASLITQVNQDDVERQKEMAKRMTARPEDENYSAEDRQEIGASEQSSRPIDCALCFSCWLCCGLCFSCWLSCKSCSRKDPQYIAKPVESYEHEDENRIVVGSDEDRSWEAVEMKGSSIVQDEKVDTNDDQFSLEISETLEDWLLGPVLLSDKGRKCLVLDLDETLVHSSFEPIDCSFSISIELGGMQYGVYVLKRPFVDEFIAECAKYYELVVFTASLSEYANPVIDTLDKNGYIKHRLFRESCVFHEEQVYVKDLSRLGRKLKDCIIIDNSPLSYLFQPTNAIGCTSWFGNQEDTELRDLLPVLRGKLLKIDDVRTMLDANSQSCEWLINQYGDRDQESPINEYSW